MAGDHSAAINVNKNILINELGLKQISRTTVYKKRGCFILSPSMQSTKSMWFDLRKVNIDRYNREIEKGYLLIRYFDKFLLADLDDFFNKMISFDQYVETANSGVHWKFKILTADSSYIIQNMMNKREYPIREYPIREFEVEELKEIISR